MKGKLRYPVLIFWIVCAIVLQAHPTTSEVDTQLPQHNTADKENSVQTEEEKEEAEKDMDKMMEEMEDAMDEMDEESDTPEQELFSSTTNAPEVTTSGLMFAVPITAIPERLSVTPKPATPVIHSVTPKPTTAPRKRIITRRVASKSKIMRTATAPSPKAKPTTSTSKPESGKNTIVGKKTTKLPLVMNEMKLNVIPSANFLANLSPFKKNIQKTNKQ